MSVKLDNDSEVSYSLDKATGTAQAEVARQGRTADGSYSLKAQFEDDPNIVSGTPPEEQTTLNASYSGERFDVGASYSRQVLQGGGTLGSFSTISGAGAMRLPATILPSATPSRTVLPLSPRIPQSRTPPSGSLQAKRALAVFPVYWVMRLSPILPPIPQANCQFRLTAPGRLRSGLRAI